MPFKTTIGLEVHAELSTRTKMFCACKNDPDERRPNINICPVCLAHPGTLPVPNREAVRHVLRIGAAVGGTLADFSEFDRKSYFYPDMPKGYQISQYEYPLVSGGILAGVALTRIHLEEDTARSSHGEGKSLVDFNRAGIPLMELVTEPVIHDAQTAGKFARELQLLLRTLEAGNANLEKGEMRIEANISVSDTEGVFGTKVEVKNINSFRAVERAIAYEVERQIALIEKGESVVQATRGWDDVKMETFHQRVKEGSADYRYFPEPDIPKLSLREIPEFAPEILQADLPELPQARRARYAEAYSLKLEDIAYISASLERSRFFDAVTHVLNHDAVLIMQAANYFTSDLAGIFTKNGEETYEKVSAESFAELMHMIAREELSSRGAKEVLALLVQKGGSPEALAKEHGFLQVHDTEALRAAVLSVIETQQKAVGEYRSGKDASLQFLVGMAMRETKGAGNPGKLRELLIEELGRE